MNVSARHQDLLKKTFLDYQSTEEFMANPLIVPVKILRGHKATEHIGVMAVAFHPSRPWLFSAGGDGEIVLWTAL